MAHHRLFGLGVVLLLLATAFWVASGVGLTTPRGQEASSPPPSSPKLPEAERARRLAEAERHKEEALRLAKTGELDEAVTAIGKGLAVEREVLGELHEEVVISLNFLAKLHELREDWAGARQALKEVL